ncbi:MAG: Txe/YoeB family addiction module toxin [Akkermansia sp.]
MKIKFITNYAPEAEQDMRYWHRQDKKILKRILRLIENMEETPFSGLGKPESLKHGLSGCWSRRIDTTNRLVYEVDEDAMGIWILQARHHYTA